MKKAKGKPGRKPKVTAVAVVEQKAVVKVAAGKRRVPPVLTREAMTEKYVLDAFDMLGIAAKLDERGKKLFVEIARMNNLNPLKREIHAVAMWDSDTEKYRLTPVTGYEVYIDRAEESGRLEYWNVGEEGSIKDKDYRAILTIKRRDWAREFKWVARYSEVMRCKRDGTPTAIWKERPTFMTQKVAISQGFRLCFRDVLRGMPYTADEMIGDEPRNVTPIAEPKAIEVKPAEPKPVSSAPQEPIKKKPDAPIPTTHETVPAPVAPGSKGEFDALMAATEKVPGNGLVTIFTDNEKIDWKAVANDARDNKAALTKVFADIRALVDARRKAIRGDKA